MTIVTPPFLGTTGIKVLSNIYNLDGVVQNNAIGAGKALIIDYLRDIFKRDERYKYITDIFGFPKTPNHKDLDPDTGLVDSESTRIFIGSTYRYDVPFLPAVLVKHSSTNYKPLAFNPHGSWLNFQTVKTIDESGNETFTVLPTFLEYRGAWDQNFEIKVLTKSAEDTIQIADIILASLQGTFIGGLLGSGLFIKSTSAGGESEESINSNDPLFSISISVETFSEFHIRRNVNNIIERIKLAVDIEIFEGSSAHLPILLDIIG